ncbi:MAG: two-component sensor histidine kinase, partial [Anaerolinea sp.]|nr:two-component sensor histidine kinase [Anaerolinea sp.]
SNLVDNAIKYSGEGSHVVMRAVAEHATIAIDVTDNGAGIADDDLQRVFDRFYRVDKGRSRREGGSGLGLAIVQEVVRALGGTVSVRSQLGEGTTFTIRLPRSTGEPGEQAPAAPIDRAIARRPVAGEAP